MEGLRRSSEEIWIAHGLLLRAASRRAIGEFPNAAADLQEALDIAERGEIRAASRRAIGEFPNAAADLQEALDIAERGEMRLYLTDYHLESARLMLAQIAAGREAAEAQAMRAKAEEHYAVAEKLIEDTGYKRRPARAGRDPCLPRRRDPGLHPRSRPR